MVQMKKRTKSETRGRRSHHALKAKTLVKCPQCGQMALPHTACAFCGTYKGRQVIKIKSAATKTNKTAKTAKPAKAAKPATAAAKKTAAKPAVKKTAAAKPAAKAKTSAKKAD